MDVPDLTDDFIQKIATQSDSQSRGRSIQELERSRDDTLVGIIRALMKTDRGAGKTLNNHNQSISNEKISSNSLIETVRRQVPQTWTDYNGHMNESNYLEVCSQATDKFMELIGMDINYVQLTKESFFTVETHIRHLNEINEGMVIIVKTQVLEINGKKLRLFHHLQNEEGEIIATGEHMLIHVDLKTRSSSLPNKKIKDKIDKFALEHSYLDWPKGAGNSIGGNK